MLALRLIRVARPAVQARRLTVAAASAGTGFLLLGTLGYALGHPENSGAAVLRLAWCVVPLAATVYLAVAVARTDPGTRPRPGLSAIGLGPVRLMAVSAATTALSCTLGALLALLVFLHLRGDLTGTPVSGTATEFLAPYVPLPLPGALTLLLSIPALASTSVALTLRPRGPAPTRADGTPRRFGRFGAYRRGAKRETFGAYGRFGAGARSRRQPAGSRAAGAARAGWGSPLPEELGDTPTAPDAWTDADGARSRRQPAGSRAAGAARAGWGSPLPEELGGGAPSAPGRATHPSANGVLEAPDAWTDPDGLGPDPLRPPAPGQPPSGLPWGAAVLAAGLAVEAYAGRSAATAAPTLPGGVVAGSLPLLAGWLLTALGLALAGPGLTHLCGRLLQSAQPGARRLLAGRVLMAEAHRIGRPLGVVCAVASGTYAMLALYDRDASSFGPLTTLGTLVVTGCAVATLLTAAVEVREARADTTAALVRLGAPTTVLRSVVALRASALLALFGPLTLLVAGLAALPLSR